MKEGNFQSLKLNQQDKDIFKNQFRQQGLSSLEILLTRLVKIRLNYSKQNSFYFLNALDQYGKCIQITKSAENKIQEVLSKYSKLFGFQQQRILEKQLAQILKMSQNGAILDLKKEYLIGGGNFLGSSNPYEEKQKKEQSLNNWLEDEDKQKRCQYVKSIQSQQVIDNLQNLTDKYLIAISKNDKETIQYLTKKSLCEKTNQWIDEVNKKGETFQLLGTETKSVSLQCFTSCSYIYGLANNLDNKKFENQRIFNLNKNFLVKRLLFIDGFKAHQLFTQKSILVEAFVYNSLRISIKKGDSKQQQSQQNLQYAGYKICFVCDGKFEQQIPYALLENDKRQLYKQEDNQKSFELNCWKIADINDWVFSDLQIQDFKKWAFSTVVDQQNEQIAEIKSTQTK